MFAMPVQNKSENEMKAVVSIGRAAAEVGCVMLIFAAAGAWPTPDSNEAHYLTKARHFFDPTWCVGDFFLETPDAHGVFYGLIGPLAARLPLDMAAWLGRWIGWLSLAIGFCHAVRPLLTHTTARLLAAALFSLALRHSTAAGEWVIGGCEAKVFAWALLFWALGEIAMGRLSSAWLSLGAATAVHPIVGGWGGIALLLEASAIPLSRRSGSVDHRRSLLGERAMLVAGTALAAVGVVPALLLSAGADAETRAAATVIYVVERLPHHLLLRTFADGFVARHVLAILLWISLLAVLSLTQKSHMPSVKESSTKTDPAWARWMGFVAASLVISLVGCLVSLAEPLAPTTVYGLLQFYWFRLADGLVPLALATTAAAVATNSQGDAAQVGWRRLALASLVCLLAIDSANESRHWPLLGRTDLAARSDTKVQAQPWREICEWIRDNTPADACFITPRGAASFTWRTGRSEVVAWKNIPQDARSLVMWRARIVDCFSRTGTLVDLERSTATLGEDRLRLVADRYEAAYAVVPLDALAIPAVHGLAANAKEPLPLPFPVLHTNSHYAVIHLTREAQ
ncbi:MAG: hypothetical protein DWI25_02285 [Planctomycetota bacterium]|nr:MAG: hypothetical protein DWI25_02285 [Planctomycetota bacterium]